jgi:hypothetical protein
VVRTTWALRGQTPILYHRFRRRENISVAGFICYHPDGRRVRLLLDHTPGAYTTATLIAALRRLPALVDRSPVILVWDRLSLGFTPPRRNSTKPALAKSTTTCDRTRR